MPLPIHVLSFVSYYDIKRSGRGLSSASALTSNKVSGALWAVISVTPELRIPKAHAEFVENPGSKSWRLAYTVPTDFRH